MQRLSATAWVALLVATALAATACTPQNRYRSVVLDNRQQEDLLQDKDAEIARLEAQNRVLHQEQTDAQMRIAEKDKQVQSVRRERDAYKQAYEKANALLKDMARQPVKVDAEGPLPEEVALEIEALVRQHPNLFEFERATGRLRFAGDITFDSGSNAVRAEARTTLMQLASILRSEAARGITVTVIGHTDSIPVKKPATVALLRGLGKTPNNQGLSEARAEAVAGVLVSGGVAQGRIATEGRGDSQPIADNGTRAGRAKNRRVEIFLK